MGGYDNFGGSGLAALSIFIGVYVAIVAFAFMIVIAVYVLNGFAFMRLFRKLGVEPWAAWVPIFNYWRLFEVGGQSGALALLALVPYVGRIIAAVIAGLAMHRIGIAFRKPGGYVALGILLPFVWAFILGSDSEVFEPDLMRQAGYGPPLVGHGSARGPYSTQPTQPSA